MATKHQWLGRPILDPDHLHDLETRSAILEFGADKLPRTEAEGRAWEEYRKDQHARAAAYHYMGVKAAQGSGNREDAHKHGAMYDLHVKALGLNSIGPVPPEVQHHVESPDKPNIYKFKAHKGDAFVLQSSKPEEPAT